MSVRCLIRSVNLCQYLSALNKNKLKFVRTNLNLNLTLPIKYQIEFDSIPIRPLDLPQWPECFIKIENKKF